MCLATRTRHRSRLSNASLLPPFSHGNYPADSRKVSSRAPKRLIHFGSQRMSFDRVRANGLYRGAAVLDHSSMIGAWESRWSGARLCQGVPLDVGVAEGRCSESTASISKEFTADCRSSSSTWAAVLWAGTPNARGTDMDSTAFSQTLSLARAGLPRSWR